MPEKSLLDKNVRVKDILPHLQVEKIHSMNKPLFVDNFVILSGSFDPYFIMNETTSMDGETHEYFLMTLSEICQNAYNSASLENTFVEAFGSTNINLKKKGSDEYYNNRLEQALDLAFGIDDYNITVDTQIFVEAVSVGEWKNKYLTFYIDATSVYENRQDELPSEAAAFGSDKIIFESIASTSNLSNYLAYLFRKNIMQTAASTNTLINYAGCLRLPSNDDDWYDVGQFKKFSSLSEDGVIETSETLIEIDRYNNLKVKYLDSNNAEQTFNIGNVVEIITSYNDRDNCLRFSTPEHYIPFDIYVFFTQSLGGEVMSADDVARTLNIIGLPGSWEEVCVSFDMLGEDLWRCSMARDLSINIPEIPLDYDKECTLVFDNDVQVNPVGRYYDLWDISPQIGSKTDSLNKMVYDDGYLAVEPLAMDNSFTIFNNGNWRLVTKGDSLQIMLGLLETKLDENDNPSLIATPRFMDSPDFSINKIAGYFIDVDDTPGIIKLWVDRWGEEVQLYLMPFSDVEDSSDIFNSEMTFGNYVFYNYFEPWNMWIQLNSSMVTYLTGESNVSVEDFIVNAGLEEIVLYDKSAESGNNAESSEVLYDLDAIEKLFLEPDSYSEKAPVE